MDVSELITEAFRQASQKYLELHRSWIQVSFRVGGLLPNSLLSMCVQRAGWLDMVLRSMEDEFSVRSQGDKQDPPSMACHFQELLSELWIGSVCQTLRLLIERKLAPDTAEFRALAHDLRLLRIPLEKHEITGKLTQPLQMFRYPPNNDSTDIYEYSKNDPKRAHIMPSGISQRGSVMWQVLDIMAAEERWIERRALSDRLLSLWGEAEGGTGSPD